MSDRETLKYLIGEGQKLEREIENKKSSFEKIERQIKNHVAAVEALQSQIEELHSKYNGDSNHDSRIKSDMVLKLNQSKQIVSNMRNAQDMLERINQEIKGLYAKLDEIKKAIEEEAEVA